MTASEITQACSKWLHYKRGYEYQEGDEGVFEGDVDLVTHDLAITFKIKREEE
jgi:hypothetical protein